MLLFAELESADWRPRLEVEDSISAQLASPANLPFADVDFAG